MIGGSVKCNVESNKSSYVWLLVKHAWTFVLYVNITNIINFIFGPNEETILFSVSD